MSARHVAPLRELPAALPAPELPASKSELNRLLVVAALLPEGTRVRPRAEADDVVHLVAGLRALGVPVEDAADGWDVGALPLDDASPRRAEVGEGGTTSRFLAALASRRAGPTELRGGEQLGRRPVEPLLAALRRLGCAAERLPGAAFAVRVRGPWGAPARCRVEVGRSSQFASALLLAAPPEGLGLEWSGEPVSRPYLDMTLAALRAGGATVREGADAGERGGARPPRAPGVRVEAGSAPVERLVGAPDASSATYPAALATLAGSVRLPGLARGAAQPDARFPDLLAAMGAETAREGDDVVVHSGPLRGRDLDARECPDLVPALAVTAALADGSTRITGAGHLRYKESDRLDLLVRGLRAFGVEARAGDDALEVGGRPDALHPDAHPPTGGDHRMAMAFAVLARAGRGAWIEDPDCVRKSWPGFWDWLEGADHR